LGAGDVEGGEFVMANVETVDNHDENMDEDDDIPPTNFNDGEEEDVGMDNIEIHFNPDFDSRDAAQNTIEEDNTMKEGSLHSLQGTVNILNGDSEGQVFWEEDDSYKLNRDNFDWSNSLASSKNNPFVTLDDGGFNPTSFFTIENGFPEASAAFFTAQHKTNNARKDILKRCFFPPNSRQPPDNRIRDDDVNKVFHETSRYYNMTSTKIPNICSMISFARLKERNHCSLIEKCYVEAIRSEIEALDLRMDHGANVNFAEEIAKKIVEKKQSNFAESRTGYFDIGDVEQEKDVRAKYLEGPRSIVKLLPTPDVRVLVLQEDEKVEYAHIEAEQIINHMLAYDHHDCYYYRAGVDADWDPRSYPNDPIRGIFLNSKRCREVRKKVKKLVDEGKVPIDTRIAFIRPWSDGFSAYAITANNEYNSIQVFTIRMKGKKDFILPHALLFKKNNSRWLVVKLLEECKALEEPKLRYWARDRQPITTMVFLDFVSNDFPERCYNTGFAQNGSCSHRWGHSCAYVDEKTPTCESCNLKRVQLILEGSCDTEALGKCGKCDDWWRDTQTDLKEYPIKPDWSIMEIKKIEYPSVRLSLEMMSKAMDDINEWFRSQPTGTKTAALKVVHQYLKMICMGYGDKLCKEFGDEHIHHISQGKTYPPIMIHYARLSVEMCDFPSVVMHLFFLGIMKRITSESNRLKVINFTTRGVRDWWASFITRIHDQQVAIKNLSVTWCNPMSFAKSSEETDKDEGGHLSTVGWMSSHHMSFNRILLFQYSKLDKKMGTKPPEGFDKVISGFIRLIVVWFCLVANSFGGEAAVPSLRIDHLARLFLSSCREFHFHARKGDERRGFYETTSNFFSLLNCKDLIEQFGSLRYLWEGEDEQFIKCLKKEVATLRHNTNSLKNLLQKLVTTMVLRDLNINNPLRESTVRSRLFDFKVYRCDKNEDAIDVLKLNQFLTGVVDKSGSLYVCFLIQKEYRLFKLLFDDQNGMCLLNLWYSKVRLSRGSIKFSDRGEMLDFAIDHFILLKQASDDDEDIEGLATVICHSWRVRMEDGRLELPMPRREYLYYVSSTEK